MADFSLERDDEVADDEFPAGYVITAREGQAWVGELTYKSGRRASFLLGVSVRYDRQRRGIGLGLLWEWAERCGSRQLMANVARENTEEGEALLQAFERERGTPLRRVDTGLDGRW